MNDLTPEWAQYCARQRDALARSAREVEYVDPASWGREKALDRALDAISAGETPETVAALADLAGRSRARLERSQASAREGIRLVSGDDGIPAPDRALFAANDLRLCLLLVQGRPKDAQTLAHVALNGDRAGPPAGVKDGTYRVRLSRLRARLSAALAA